MGQLSLTIAEVLPMVSDFLTVASFAVLMLTKLLLKATPHEDEAVEKFTKK